MTPTQIGHNTKHDTQKKNEATKNRTGDRTCHAAKYDTTENLTPTQIGRKTKHDSQQINDVTQNRSSDQT